MAYYSSLCNDKKIHSNVAIITFLIIMSLLISSSVFLVAIIICPVTVYHYHSKTHCHVYSTQTRCVLHSDTPMTTECLYIYIYQDNYQLIQISRKVSNPRGTKDFC